MTIIIGLLGASGCGKSTSASYLFYKLKKEDINAELVQEYVKSWAWEGRVVTDLDQLYLLGKQARKEILLMSKVDVIVTDCPVALSGFYGNKYCSDTIAKGVEFAVDAYYNSLKEKGHNYCHYLLERTKKYNPLGRYQTEDEAKLLDIEMKEYFTNKNIDYITSNTDEDSLDIIFNNTLKLLNK